MENAERKARKLLEAIMENEREYAAQTVFNLLSILDPEDFVSCGYATELEDCIDEYAELMDDELQRKIMRALKILP